MYVEAFMDTEIYHRELIVILILIRCVLPRVMYDTMPCDVSGKN